MVTISKEEHHAFCWSNFVNWLPAMRGTKDVNFMVKAAVR